MCWWRIFYFVSNQHIWVHNGCGCGGAGNGGKRRKNRIPDTGEPNTVQWNNSKTTAKKYGPDVKVQKEFNKGHTQHQEPNPKGWNDHIHDYKPNPYHPNGKGDRMPPRIPKKGEVIREFPEGD